MVSASGASERSPLIGSGQPRRRGCGGERVEGGVQHVLDAVAGPADGDQAAHARCRADDDRVALGVAHDEGPRVGHHRQERALVVQAVDARQAVQRDQQVAHAVGDHAGGQRGAQLAVERGRAEPGPGGAVGQPVDVGARLPVERLGRARRRLDGGRLGGAAGRRRRSGCPGGRRRRPSRAARPTPTPTTASTAAASTSRLRRVTARARAVTALVRSPGVSRGWSGAALSSRSLMSSSFMSRLRQVGR